MSNHRLIRIQFQFPTQSRRKLAAQLLRLTFVGALVVAVLSSATLGPASTPAVYAESDEVDATQNLRLPLLSNNDCSSRKDPDMPLGVQMYGKTGRSSPLFGFLQNTGASWVRVNIEWREVEPSNTSPDQFNWTNADEAMAASQDACINIIATLEYTADWAATAGPRSAIKEEFLDEYAEYVEAVVERYDGDGVDDAPNGAVVNHFEFYNEPDFETADGNNEGWGPYGDRYAEMLETIYPIAKAANPDVQIVIGGLAYEWFSDQGGLFTRSFLDDILDAGGGDYFDMINLHCYPFPNNCLRWAEEGSTGMVEKILAVRAKLDEYDIEKPLAITEVGWHSSDNHAAFKSNDDIQGRYLVQLLTQALAYDAEIVIWWMLENPQATSPGEEGYPYDTGLVTGKAPRDTKPAYHVFRTLLLQLGRAQFLGVTSSALSPNHLEAYRFRNPKTGKVFYVAWHNPVTTTKTVDFTINAATVTVYDKHYNQVDVVTDADDGTLDGKLTVEVGGNPRYIVLN